MPALNHIRIKVFHEKWLELGSAYDVEDEYLEANTLRRVREQLYAIGFSAENPIEVWLRNWQLEITQRAFKKIPETDGERIIWELWLNQAFLSELRKDYVSTENIKNTLGKFTELTAQPIASSWANDERYAYANRMAGYFFKHGHHVGMQRDNVNRQRLAIITKMNDMEPKLNLKALLSKSEDYYHVIPLVWNDTIYRGAGNIIVDPDSKEMTCNPEAIKILFIARSRLQKLIAQYGSTETDTYNVGWMKSATNDLKFDPTELLEKNCPRTFK